MKLRFIKQIEGSTVCYGQTVKTGDVVDSSVWGEQAEAMAQKAIRTMDWEKAVDAPVAPIPAKPKHKGK